ncbi:MAG: membrane lipoprotein lipid attachment site-containing protein [Patescibacteria group bacterium]|nr:membrane lipoprotein lipid attachment site-containing protein [Patescibacteria group bacterium]
MKKIIFLFVSVLLLAGCDYKIVKEQPTQNFTIPSIGQIQTSSRATPETNTQTKQSNLTLQAKCSKDAENFFNLHWRKSIPTGMLALDYQNHYNKTLDKCFILIIFNFKTDIGDGSPASYTNDKFLYDVYENVQYGTIDITDKILQKCEVSSKKCVSLDDFNNLSESYMNN